MFKCCYCSSHHFLFTRCYCYILSIDRPSPGPWCVRMRRPLTHPTAYADTRYAQPYAVCPSPEALVRTAVRMRNRLTLCPTLRPYTGGWWGGFGGCILCNHATPHSTAARPPRFLRRLGRTFPPALKAGLHPCYPVCSCRGSRVKPPISRVSSNLFTPHAPPRCVVSRVKPPSLSSYLTSGRHRPVTNHACALVSRRRRFLEKMAGLRQVADSRTP